VPRDGLPRAESRRHAAALKALARCAGISLGTARARFYQADGDYERALRLHFELQHERLKVSLDDSPLRQRRRAYGAVRKATVTGHLVRQPCEVCGDTAIVHGHHDDYDEPLKVVWLCPKHHAERHKAAAARELAPARGGPAACAAARRVALVDVGVAANPEP
jgi:hypothetical protein